jgi:hypothetical protein
MPHDKAKSAAKQLVLILAGSDPSRRLLEDGVVRHLLEFYRDGARDMRRRSAGRAVEWRVRKAGDLGATVTAQMIAKEILELPLEG